MLVRQCAHHSGKNLSLVCREDQIGQENIWAKNDAQVTVLSRVVVKVLTPAGRASSEPHLTVFMRAVDAHSQVSATAERYTLLLILVRLAVSDPVMEAVQKLRLLVSEIRENGMPAARPVSSLLILMHFRQSREIVGIKLV